MENFSEMIDLQNSVIKTEKILSVSPLKQPTWKIHMRVGAQAGVIRLTNKNIAGGPKEFDCAMFGTFGVFLPRELYIKECGMNANWFKFVYWLAKNAEVIPNGRSRK